MECLLVLTMPRCVVASAVASVCPWGRCAAHSAAQVHRRTVPGSGTMPGQADSTVYSYINIQHGNDVNKTGNGSAGVWPLHSPSAAGSDVVDATEPPSRTCLLPIKLSRHLSDDITVDADDAVSQPLSRRRHSRRVLAAIALGSLLAAGFFLFVYRSGKCDMAGNLMPLFSYFISQLNRVNAEYWIDYGTLLGGVRDHALLPHEFDLDLAAREEECPRIIEALKPQMKADGYHAYERGEWIEAKHNRLLGYDGYMHKPCFRVYDHAHEIYIDIDWYRTFTPAQVIEANAHAGGHIPLTHVSSPSLLNETVPVRSGGLDLPAGYDPLAGNGNVLCNEEGISGGDAGGCRLESWMFPLRPFLFGAPAIGAATNGGAIDPQPHSSDSHVAGGASDAMGGSGTTVARTGRTASGGRMPVLRTFVPADVERNLEAMYGPTWRVPRGKGYKLLLCGWFPATNAALFSALLVSVLLLPMTFYFLLASYCCRLSPFSRAHSHGGSSHSAEAAKYTPLSAGDSCGGGGSSSAMDSTLLHVLCASAAGEEGQADGEDEERAVTAPVSGTELQALRMPN